MATYHQQMHRIVQDYRKSGEPWPAASKTIAEWAISSGRWELPASAAVNRCAEDLSAAMREEYYTDPKGRRVRLFHPARRYVAGQQLTLWDDIRTTSRQHMQLSLQQRRQNIVGDCRQLKIDGDSFNDAHASEPAIQMVFDFTMDLAELEAASAA
ncbi:MAG TPA: hypothetical protein VN805_09445 [Caulobacteraceae bacterium]|nr:hypothetical protein [Caulobacteraceae bacterium]